MINYSSKDTALRIGMVSPYGWDTPGGVQTHIKDLAKYYIDQGHYVSVLAPVSDETLLADDFVVPAGRPISIPYNGAVARVLLDQSPHRGCGNGYRKAILTCYIYMNRPFLRYRF